VPYFFVYALLCYNFLSHMTSEADKKKAAIFK
jgi:hypothetical protein